MTSLNVFERFERWAASCPDMLAIDSPSAPYTYRTLSDASTRVARVVRANGTGPGEPVAILARDPSLVAVGMLGAIAAGVVAVPLDLTTPATRLVAILSEVRPGCLLVDRAGQQVIAEINGSFGAHGRLIRLDEQLALPAQAISIDSPVGDRPCYVYFTSGSTGRPKGIAGCLRSIDHFVSWEISLLKLAPGTRVSQLTSPAFDAFLRDLFVPLASGGTICVPPDPGVPFGGDTLMGWLEEQRIGLVHCVPSLFRSLLTVDDPPPLASLHTILLAGEVLSPQDVSRWQERYQDRIRLVNMYGPSETTMTKLFHLVTAADAQHRSVPIGKPMPGARAILLDPNGEPCPPGVVGEIYLRTPFRTLGYFRRPDLTSRAFLPNPLSGDPADLVYRTGDLARLRHDGSFDFVGRRDGQVKVRGVRVEIAEVEAALRQHSSVREAAVVGRDDLNGSTYLVAHVVGADTRPDHGELRALAARVLPPAAVPSLFVDADSLPRTLSGKVDRHRLAAAADVDVQTEHSQDPPRTALEQAVARVCREVLGRKHVGVHDNFFEIGGHSLLATQVVSRLRSLLSVDLTLPEFFEHATVAALAARIERHSADGAPVLRIPVADRGGEMPLSFSQEWLCSGHPIAAEDPHHNVVTGVRISGELDEDALRQSLTDIVRRHEALRTRLVTGQTGMMQVIEDDGVWPLTIADLQDIDEVERPARLRQLVEGETRQPFKLAEGPLMRGALVRLGAGHNVLLLTMHHVVTDNWSFGVLVRELAQFYDARSTGREPVLPPLTVQYPDVAAWQRRRYADGSLDVQRDYWREQLRDLPAEPRFALPDPRADEAVSGAVHPFALNAELSARLSEIAGRENVTVFMLLLAAFDVLLSGLSSDEDIVVGCPIANREWPETHPLIGYFVNTLVMRTDLTGVRTFRELLQRVRRVALAAYTNQEIPLHVVREDLAGGRDLFKIAFNLLNAPMPPLVLGDLRLEPLRLDSGYVSPHVLPGLVPTSFQLALVMREEGEELQGMWLRDTDHIGAQLMGRMMRRWQPLLEAVAEDIDTDLARLRGLVREPGRPGQAPARCGESGEG